MGNILISWTSFEHRNDDCLMNKFINVTEKGPPSSYCVHSLSPFSRDGADKYASFEASLLFKGLFQREDLPLLPSSSSFRLRVGFKVQTENFLFLLHSIPLYSFFLTLQGLKSTHCHDGEIRTNFEWL